MPSSPSTSKPADKAAARSNHDSDPDYDSICEYDSPWSTDSEKKDAKAAPLKKRPANSRAAPPKTRPAIACENHARACLQARHAAAMHALQARHDAEVRRLGRKIRAAGDEAVQRITADGDADDGQDVVDKLVDSRIFVIDWRFVAVHGPVAVLAVFVLVLCLSRQESRGFTQTGPRPESWDFFL